MALSLISHISHGPRPGIPQLRYRSKSLLPHHPLRTFRSSIALSTPQTVLSQPPTAPIRTGSVEWSSLSRLHERNYSAAFPSMRRLKQSSDTILMIAPSHFEYNADAAVDNKFMNAADQVMTPKDIVEKAMQQFLGAVKLLRDKGVRVIVKSSDDSVKTPDAVFPNNWFSTHAPAEVTAETLVLYPMKVPNRRLERRPAIIADLRKSYPCLLDLSVYEERNLFLEGTGSLVLDRVNKIAFAALSERTHKLMVEIWAEHMKYESVLFEAVDSNRAPIYHTNVLMFIGSELAIVCEESIVDKTQRKKVLDALGRHHSVMPITQAQMRALCGNVIEVHNGDEPLFVTSTRAYRAFTESQKRQIAAHYKEPVVCDVDLIEAIGGGGIRCMIAELFSPG